MGGPRWFVLGALAALGIACGDDGSRGPMGAETTDGSTGGASDSTGSSTSSSTSAGTSGSDSGTTETGDADPGADPWDPVPDAEPLDDARLEGLRAVIDGILATPSVAAATKVVLIVDLETDQVLYERGPDEFVVPASNTKLFSTAAAIDVLGPDHRPRVSVYASASPDGGGTVSTLYVVGEHDPTWSTALYGSPRFVMDRIAEATYEAGVRTVSGDVIVQGEFCVEGSTLGSYDPDAERAEAATQVEAALSAAGISAPPPSMTASFAVPASSVELAVWKSIPIGDISAEINAPSHNEFADLLLRHFGWEQAGTSSYPPAGAAVRDWMGSIPTQTGGVVFNDGSGLSHGNRVSARNIVDLVRYMLQTPGGHAFVRGLAVAGVRGTLSSRMTTPDLQGRVWAKTGTLPSIGVVATSGLLFHRHDARRYGFAIVFNGASDVAAARSVQDMVVAAVGTDLRQAGPMPSAPVLRRVEASSSSVIEIEWEAVADAERYVVWLSPDGQTWSVDDARLVDGPVHRAGDLPFGPNVWVRVTAVTLGQEGPVHSAPSDTYGASVLDGPPVLIVDGNDRWSDGSQPENPLAEGHGYAVEHGEALAGTPFATVANEAVVDGDVVLQDHEVVLWMLGEESAEGRTFDELEQDLVRAFVEQGGGLMVSGAELGYDLVELGTPADTAFFTDVLGAQYEGDDAGTTVVRPGVTLAAAVDPWIDFLRPTEIVVGYPDRLSPDGDAESWLSYAGGLGGAAMVATSGTAQRGPTVVMGFPFETVADASQRHALLAAILAFFGP